MPTTETRTVVFARPVADDRDAFMHGVSAEDESYGRVQVIRATRTEQRRSDGTRMPGTSAETTEEVLLELDAAQATHLMTTLTTALADALRVRDGARLR